MKSFAINCTLVLSTLFTGPALAQAGGECLDEKGFTIPCPSEAEKPKQDHAERFLPKIGDAAKCYGRVYDKTHLSKHPDQLLREMMLELSLSKEPSPDTKLEDYNFRLQVTIRGSEKPLWTGGYCGWQTDESDGTKSSYSCQVECDGGGFDIEEAKNQQSIVLFLDRRCGHLPPPQRCGLFVRMSNSCGADESDDGYELTPGKDDKSFRLDPIPAGICSSEFKPVPQQDSLPSEGSNLSASKSSDLSPDHFLVSNIYKGKTHFPDFNGRDRKFVDYRTRIREGLSEGPNFAGHYSVIQIGCGTGCIGVYIADNRTGKVYDLFPSDEIERIYLDLGFRLSSRLIIAQWVNYDSKKCTLEYFSWDENGAKILDTKILGGEDACSRHATDPLADAPPASTNPPVVSTFGKTPAAFIISTQSVTSPIDPRCYLKLDDTLSFSDLKTRCDKFSVTEGEDEGSSALYIKAGETEVEALYDTDTKQMRGIMLYGKGGMDVAGHRSGDAFVNAIGSANAMCETRDIDKMILCESSMKRLEYAFEGNDQCPGYDQNVMNEKKSITLQQCWKIDGFEIWR